MSETDKKLVNEFQKLVQDLITAVMIDTREMIMTNKEKYDTIRVELEFERRLRKLCERGLLASLDRYFARKGPISEPEVSNYSEYWNLLEDDWWNKTTNWRKDKPKETHS